MIRPANLENVFRGTFRVKKRDLPAKSGTVGRAHIEIRKKKSDFEQKAGHFHDLAGRGTSGKKSGTVPPKAGRLAGLNDNGSYSRRDNTFNF